MSLRWRVTIAALAIAMSSGCATPPTVSMKVGELSETGMAHYLVLADQLDRVRKFGEVPARLRKAGKTSATVCVGVLPEPVWLIAPADDALLERLRNDETNQEFKFNFVSSPECLARYTLTDEPFDAEPTDVLAYVGLAYQGGKCGKWVGGVGNDGGNEYDLKINNGVATLTGGRGCAAYGRWIRS